MICKCYICGKVIKRSPSNIESTVHKKPCCSRKCADIFRAELMNKQGGVKNDNEKKSI